MWQEEVPVSKLKPLIKMVVYTVALIMRLSKIPVVNVLVSVVSKQGLGYRYRKFHESALLSICFSDSAVITEPQEDRKQVEEGGVCECKADGNPSPKYYWKSAAGVVLSTNNTLIVTKDGNYTCVAENKIGNDTHRIFIEIKSKSHLQIFIISKY